MADRVFEPFVDQLGASKFIVSGSASGSVSPLILSLPNVRTVATGGYASDEVDPYRQGVEVSTVQKRGSGIRPFIGTSLTTNFLETTVFGQPEYETSNKVEFNDVLQFRSESIIRFTDSTSSVVHPLTIDNPPEAGGTRLDGIIEPLQITPRTEFFSTETPKIGHYVRGAVMDGNLDVFGRSDIIRQEIEISLPTTVEAFYDGDELFGESFASASNLAVKRFSPVFDQFRTVAPYDDVLQGGIPNHLSSMTGSLISDFDIVINSSSFDYGMISLGYKSAIAGFTYSGSFIGTDSIAFGGLKK